MHPEDPIAFGAPSLPALRAATADLSFLQGRGYAPTSSRKVVGDRYALTLRQRDAVARCACDDQRAQARKASMLPASALRAQTLRVDGFNVLTTLEVALGGGIVLLARDGTLRDIAGVHGTYRMVQETVLTLEVLARLARDLSVHRCVFLFDRPVSNSGRLRALVDEQARVNGWPFESHVVPDPDDDLVQSADIVASADGAVLDRCVRWFNLARACVQSYVPSARIVDLSRE